MLKTPHIKQFTSKKILRVTTAQRLCRQQKKQGKTIGLCHGGFDLLHPGHVQHIVSAKKLCDILILSVTSDRYVSHRKGHGRPIFSHGMRAYMLSKLQDVDYVVVANFKTAVEVISKIKPSFYIKGPDYQEKTSNGIIQERKVMEKIGGKVLYTTDPKLSTSQIINYIKKMVN